MLRLPVRMERINYFCNRKLITGGTPHDLWNRYLISRGKTTLTREQLTLALANASGLATTLGTVQDRCRHFFETLNDI
jgi:hypothetical protein